MAILTKEQMQKLTKEQQEAFAALELRRVQKRQQLLEQARPYSGSILLPCAVGLIYFFLLFTFPGDGVLLQMLMLPLLFLLIQFHAFWTNRRLNALLDLLGDDIRRKPQEEQPSDENVA